MTWQFIFALFIALILVACCVKSYTDSLMQHLRNKIAQLNVLRLWVSHFFIHLSKEEKELARKELAEIIIDNENYECVKEWYNFFFSESKKSK